MLDNDSQLHHPLVYSLHLSLLTSCLGNIQWRWAPTALVSCCNSLFLECFMFHASMVVQFTFLHPSNRGLLFTLKKLKIESLFRARSFNALLVVHFAGAPSIFVSKFVRFSLAIFSLLFLTKLAAGFDLAPFRKNVVHSSPRPRCLGYKFIVYLLFTSHGTIA